MKTPEQKGTRAEHVATMRAAGFIVVRKSSIVRQITEAKGRVRAILMCFICKACWTEDKPEWHNKGCALPQGDK